MSISGRGARNKGFSYEREVAAEFNDALGTHLYRTPNSGGLHVPCDLRGDLDGFAIECKRHERLALWACLDQAQRQALADEVPLLVFRRNHGSSFVALPLKHFIGLLAELQEYQRGVRPDAGHPGAPSH